MEFKNELVRPEQQFDLFHGNQKNTVVLWTRNAHKKKWHTLSATSRTRDTLALQSNAVDVYMTPNEFYGWRRINLLATLNAQYIDVDAHNGENILEIVECALSALIKEKIPDPNIIVWSGRGAHFYWLIDPTPAKALPRWQAVQRRLIDITGADKMCADATRVLRLVGTINSENGVKTTAEILNRIPFNFDWLADQILPINRLEIRDRRTKITPDATKAISQRKVRGSIFIRWHFIYFDLYKIIEWNWPKNSVPADSRCRNTILFHLANALSWFTVSDSLEDEIRSVARKMTPSLTEFQVINYTSSIVHRARMSAEGEDEHRYKYRRSTLYRLLKHLIPDGLLAELRAIIPDELAIERKHQFDKQRREGQRRNDGSIMRSEYLSVAERRREYALSSFQNGETVKEISKKMEVSIRSVQNWIHKK
jgi:hypothetical protein